MGVVVAPVSDLAALSFMSLFPEMLEGPFVELCEWVGSGRKTQLLNLAAFHNMKVVGLFPCEKYPGRIMIHACFLPGYRGEFARQSAKEAFQWIFSNTKYSKISAYIEPCHVKQYALECGMVEKDGLFEVTK